jgi:hypothetical protein
MLGGVTSKIFIKTRTLLTLMINLEIGLKITPCGQPFTLKTGVKGWPHGGYFWTYAGYAHRRQGHCKIGMALRDGIHNEKRPSG